MSKNKLVTLIVVIVLIVVGTGVGMSFFMKSDENINGEQQNNNIDNSSTNEDSEIDEYGIFTDIEAISETKWEETNSMGIISNRSTFEMLYERYIGYRFGAIAIPRTNFYSYPTIGNQDYKIEINANKWFFLENISEMKFEEGSQQDFYVLDTTFGLKECRLEVSKTNYEDTNDYKNEPDSIKIYEYNDWKFAGIKHEDGNIFFLGGYYPLDTLCINYLSLSRLEMKEEKFKDFCEELSKNVIIEKTDGANDKKVELPKEYSTIKLSDEIYFDLGNVELFAWNSTGPESDIFYNGIVFSDDNLGGLVVLNEYETGTIFQEVKEYYTEGVLQYSNYSFETYNYEDMELELLFRDKKLHGVIFEANEHIYDLNGIIGINNKDDLLKYVFENIIITND